MFHLNFCAKIHLLSYFRIDRKAIFGIFAKKIRGQNNFSVTSFMLEQCKSNVTSLLFLVYECTYGYEETTTTLDLL